MQFGVICSAMGVGRGVGGQGRRWGRGERGGRVSDRRSGLPGQRAATQNRGDTVGVAFIEVAAALEDFERVFLVGQAESLGAAGAHDRNVIGCVEGRLASGGPLEIMADPVAAPGRRIVIERRAIIGQAGRVGNLRHAPMMRRGTVSVQRMFSIGAIGGAYGASSTTVSVGEAGRRLAGGPWLCEVAELAPPRRFRPRYAHPQLPK